MNPSESKQRRLLALHNAEIAGREKAKSGGKVRDNPYSHKKLRGAVVELYRAWERGFNEYVKEMGQ